MRLLELSEAFYYAMVAFKNYDPYDKKKNKQPVFGYKKFAEWQQEHINIIERIEGHLDETKPLDFFTLRDVKEKGVSVLKKKEIKKEVRTIRGQKIISLKD